MSRNTRPTIDAGTQGWDGPLNDALIQLYDRPLPPVRHNGTFASLEAAYPADQNDQSLALCWFGVDDTTGWALAFSNGSSWRLLAGWEQARKATTTITTAYTVADGDDIVEADTASNLTITLPSVNAANGGRLLVVRSAGAGTITVSPASSQTVAGEGSLTLEAAGTSYMLVSDGANDWRVLASHDPSLVGSGGGGGDATQAWVTSQLSSYVLTSTLSSYATQAWVNTQLSSKAESDHTHDLSSYATEQYVDDEIAAASLGGGGGSTTFTGLTDTPGSLTDGKILKVSGGALVEADEQDISGKADTGHTHTTSDVTGLDTALAGKAGTGHTHTVADITDMPTVPANISDLADVPALVADKFLKVNSAGDAVELVDEPAGSGGGAPADHTHPTSDVTGLDTALADKADITYVDAQVSNATLPRRQQSFTIACSDEVTAISAAGEVARFRMPQALTLTGVRLSLTGATTTGTIRVYMTVNGSAVFSGSGTQPTIDATETTSTTSAQPGTVALSDLPDDAEVVLEVADVGDGTATGLKVTFLGHTEDIGFDLDSLGTLVTVNLDPDDNHAIVVSGDDVVSIEDRSRTGTLLTVPSGHNGPTTETYNDRRWMNFGGTDQVLTADFGTSTDIGTSDFVMSCVVRVPETGSIQSVLDIGETGRLVFDIHGSGEMNNRFVPTSTGTERNLTASGTDLTDGAVHVATLRRVSGNLYHYLDGVQVGGPYTASEDFRDTTGAGLYQHLKLGGDCTDSTTVNCSFGGTIGQVVICNGSGLADQQLTDLHTYLMDKWGVGVTDTGRSPRAIGGISAWFDPQNLDNIGSNVNSTVATFKDTINEAPLRDPQATHSGAAAPVSNGTNEAPSLAAHGGRVWLNHGTGRYLHGDVAGAKLGSGDHAIFIVFRCDTSLSQTPLIQSGKTGRYSVYLDSSGYLNGHYKTVEGSNSTDAWSATGDLRDGNAHVISVTRSGSNVSFYVDGTFMGLLTVSGDVDDGTTGGLGSDLILGGSPSTGSAMWSTLDGMLGDVIFYKGTALNVTDRESVESYLKTKWGIA